MQNRKLLSIATLLILSTGLFFLENCTTGNIYTQGKAIYEYKCANCHLPDGSGLVGNVPPLADADWLRTNTNEIACAIRYGIQGPLVVNGLKYNGVMAGHPELTEVEISNVINYMITEWYPDLQTLPPNQIGPMIEACKDWEKIKLSNPQDLAR